MKITKPLPLYQKPSTHTEEGQKLVEVNKKLIEIFDGKTKAKIAEVWD
ncbi:MAG: hypothetical protein OIN66_13260 [Candidatus Methanoperedens sp.]|nr:hypothetical protein [Candidatus Methanoperedens sp.]